MELSLEVFCSLTGAAGTEAWLLPAMREGGRVALAEGVGLWRQASGEVPDKESADKRISACQTQLEAIGLLVDRKELVEMRALKYAAASASRVLVSFAGEMEDRFSHQLAGATVGEAEKVLTKEVLFMIDEMRGEADDEKIYPK